jgi:hypothetical protein
MTSSPIIVKSNSGGGGVFLIGFFLGTLSTLGTLFVLVGYFLYTEGFIPSINTLKPSDTSIVHLEREEPEVEEVVEEEILVNPSTTSNISNTVNTPNIPNTSNIKTFVGTCSYANGSQEIVQLDMSSTGLGTFTIGGVVIPITYHYYSSLIGINANGINITILRWGQGFLEGNFNTQSKGICTLNLQEMR